MKERSWLIVRIAGALLAAILFIVLLVTIITPLATVPFDLDIFSGYVSGTLIPINDYVLAGQNVSSMLWGYRGIDSILQGLIFVVAAVGVATLFRLERGKAEKSKEE
jgi:multisubunit Na+/H+ antiporter MnhB subunit